MVQTNSQKMAQAAYDSVRRRVSPGGLPEKYASFARSFPSLVHTCGLAQAVAFAKAKSHGQYLDDLAAILTKSVMPKRRLWIALKRRRENTRYRPMCA